MGANKHPTLRRTRIAPTRFVAAEHAALFAPINLSLTKLHQGTAEEVDFNTLAAGINFAYQIAAAVHRHRPLLPDIMRASDAAAAGWHDLPAIDGGLDIYKALIRTTPRAIAVKAMVRALSAHSVPL